MLRADAAPFVPNSSSNDNNDNRQQQQNSSTDQQTSGGRQTLDQSSRCKTFQQNRRRRTRNNKKRHQQKNCTKQHLHDDDGDNGECDDDDDDDDDDRDDNGDIGVVSSGCGNGTTDNHVVRGPAHQHQRPKQKQKQKNQESNKAMEKKKRGSNYQGKGKEHVSPSHNGRTNNRGERRKQKYHQTRRSKSNPQHIPLDEQQQKHQQQKESKEIDSITSEMFPALSSPSSSSQPPQPSGLTMIQTQQNTKWTQTNEKIFQSPEEEEEDSTGNSNNNNKKCNNDGNDDFFEKLGLDRLTSQPRRTVINNTTTAATNDDDDDNDVDVVSTKESIDNQIFPSSCNNDDQVMESTIINHHHPNPQSSRPKINMDKLRDKWWAALAQKKARRAMLLELQERIQTIFVSPVEFVLNTHLKTKDKNKDDDDDISDSITTINDATSSKLDDNGVGHNSTTALHSELTPTKYDGQISVSVESFSESLDLAIRDNNDIALKELIRSWVEKSSRETDQNGDDKMKKISNDDDGRISLFGLFDEAITKIVNQDRPDLLMVTLSTADRLPAPSIKAITSNKPSKSSCKKNDPGGRYKALFTKALLHASEYGREACLSRLLSSAGPQLISTRDSIGNNVLHCCCLGSGSETALRILLKGLSSKGKGQQQLAKLLLAGNNRHQTPLHIACEKGRVDFVETFLSMCSSAVLSKVLSMEDLKDQTPLLSAVAENATDAVVCLIMWRGNHCYTSGSRTTIPDSSNDSSMISKQSTRRKKVPPCPLVWACKNGNLDLVYVLLQFSSPSGSSYSINEAICAVINSDADEETKVEAVHVLVGHGGNPFVEVLPFNGIGEEGPALRIAAKLGFNSIVRTLVETGKAEIRLRQEGRRRDPKLRQQPETFFRPMEIKENAEMDTALKLSLLESLIDGWKGVQTGIEEKIRLHLSSAALLYSLGARLQDSDLVGLRVSMDAGKLKPENDPAGYHTKNVFLATYKHFLMESMDAKKVSIFDRAPLNGWSKSLLQQAWMRKDIHNTTGCNCPWVRTEIDGIHSRDDALFNDKATLVLKDGSKLDAHRSILTRKNGKLASALRFAEMSQQGIDHDVSQEICVALSSRVCKRMLQHIYHGSIFSGWSRDKEENCHDILELMLVGEEFLCPSLIQECAMRLMSSNPTRCFCWSCAREVRVSDTFDATVDCIYSVEGPPTLLTSETALDVLAVVQHLLSIDWMDYSSASETPHSKSEGTKRVKRGGISALKDATVATILKEFAGVVKSFSFKASLELNDSSAPEVESQIMLLQMCLEEFQEADSSNPASSLISLGTTNSSNQAMSLSSGIK